MDMIEKVAKTICETGNVAGFRCTCPHPIDGWCNGARAVAQARAAIEAMLAPTEKMVQEANDYEIKYNTDPTGKYIPAPIDPRYTWDVMVYTALMNTGTQAPSSE